MTSWIDCASAEMLETTLKVVDEAPWLSKKPTSCLSTDLKYSIRMRDVCLSAVLVQHTPSAKPRSAGASFYEIKLVEHVLLTEKCRDSDSQSNIEQPQGILHK